MSEKVSITKSKLDSLANAIASVGETSVPKTIAQMESAVLELTIPPNLQSKTITPSVTQQIVSPDSGYDAFSQVTVNAIELQEKTITPTTEQQIVTPDNSLAGRISVGTTSTFYNGNTSISVFTIENQNYIANATYSFQGKLVGSNGGVINLRGSKTGSTGSLILEEYTNYTYNNINIAGIAWWAELTTTMREKFLIELGSGYSNITWTVAEEVIITNDAYETYDGLSKVTVNAMPSGTAGTPTASKGTVSNHSISVTPSVTNTTGYITGGTKTGTAVTVNVAELESGTKSITENGTGISVSGYSAVDVAVPGQVPTGIKYIWTDYDFNAQDVSSYAYCSVDGSPLLDGVYRVWVNIPADSLGITLSFDQGRTTNLIDWGDGTTSTTYSTINHTYSASGRYIIKVTYSVTDYPATRAFNQINDTSMQAKVEYIEYAAYAQNSIRNNAYQRVTSLKCIYIPAYVSSIGAGAFSECTSLIRVVCYATTPPTLASSVFYNSDNAKIYVPANSVDSYKQATNWSTYADRIEAIP